MFKNTNAFSGFSVDDAQKAKTFYSKILGLDVTDENGFLWIHTGKDKKIFVYQKDNHIPATFTILNFPVDDIDKAVDELVKKGVHFEQYTGDIETDDKGICRSDDQSACPSMAWFKDPAGNILSVVQNR